MPHIDERWQAVFTESVDGLFAFFYGLFGRTPHGDVNAECDMGVVIVGCEFKAYFFTRFAAFEGFCFECCGRYTFWCAWHGAVLDVEHHVFDFFTTLLPIIC